jgi:hypothetical protein
LKHALITVQQERCLRRCLWRKPKKYGIEE